MPQSLLKSPQMDFNLFIWISVTCFSYPFQRIRPSTLSTGNVSCSLCKISIWSFIFSISLLRILIFLYFKTAHSYFLKHFYNSYSNTLSYNSNVFVILVLAAIDCLFQCELRLYWFFQCWVIFGLCSGCFEYYRALGLIEILWRMLIFCFSG